MSVQYALQLKADLKVKQINFVLNLLSWVN